jgi:hypothetical protein
MASASTVGTIFLVVQVVAIPFFVFGTTYGAGDYSVKEYIVFRDVMAMLLLGFGYLMVRCLANGSSRYRPAHSRRDTFASP